MAGCVRGADLRPDSLPADQLNGGIHALRRKATDTGRTPVPRSVRPLVARSDAGCVRSSRRRPRPSTGRSRNAPIPNAQPTAVQLQMQVDNPGPCGRGFSRGARPLATTSYRMAGISSIPIEQGSRQRNRVGGIHELAGDYLILNSAIAHLAMCEALIECPMISGNVRSALEQLQLHRGSPASNEAGSPRARGPRRDEVVPLHLRLLD